MIGEPFQYGAVHWITTPSATTDVVGAAGATGATAHKIVTSFEKVVEKP
jgi:hypothetical protein